MVYLATLTALVTIGAVGLLSVAMRNTKPGKKRMAKEVAAMWAHMKKLTGDLIPITQEELELFSHTQREDKFRKKSSHKIARGVYVTLFHEPVMAYSFKKYMGGKVFNNSILLVLIHDHKFFFELKKGGIILTIDGNEVGTIKDGGRLIGKKTKKTLAQMLPEKNQLIPIIAYGREVANFTLPPSAEEMKKDIGHRVFEFVKNDLKEEEQLLLLAMAALELALRNISK